MADTDPLYALLRNGAPEDELERLLESGFMFDPTVSYFQVIYWKFCNNIGYKDVKINRPANVKKLISQIMILYDYGYEMSYQVDVSPTNRRSIRGVDDPILYFFMQDSRLTGLKVMKILLKMFDLKLDLHTPYGTFKKYFNRIQLLIDEGVDPNKTDAPLKRGYVLCDIVCHIDDYGEKSVKILLDAGAGSYVKVKYFEDGKKSILTFSARYCNRGRSRYYDSTPNTVKMLIEADF